MNPLLDLPLASNKTFTPFDQIKDEHFAPAFEEAIKRTKANLEKVAKANPTFIDVIEGIEFQGELLGKIQGIFFNQVSAHTNDHLQTLAKEISPKLAELANDLLLNKEIFERVKKVYESRATLSLNQEQTQLLEKTYKAFRRNGALLNESDKNKLRGIDRELAHLGQEFSDHVLKATNDYVLFIEDEKCLIELPANALEDAKATAKEKGRPDAWAFTLHFPSYYPLLQFCTDPEKRKEIWSAAGMKATRAPYDNNPVLKKIASLRHQRANLLGYATHADFVLEERMASNPSTVKNFLENLLDNFRPNAEKDLSELRALKKKASGQDLLHPWDVAYYSEKLKHEKFSLKEEELRPYFSLENVIQGVFEHARRLYGLVLKERNDIPVYHPDVKAYEAVDESTGALMGYFYADFFPRASKKGGAWMTNYLEQGTWSGEICRPHVAIVCNFTKPTATAPSLLTLDEVHTLFHEFGHSLHSLLTNCTYSSLSGTNVYWDFVELPSQIMENWVTEGEALSLFAKHYQTGEVIPASLVQKIRDSATFQASWMGVRQIAFSLLDMAWHTQDIPETLDVESFERSQLARTSFFPPTPGVSFSPAFSHIFSGGYSAGYYSYKWAEVLDADAFELFKEKGIFNREVAKKFRDNILSKGGSVHPMELYKNFRGREPDPKALLRRDGLQV